MIKKRVFNSVLSGIMACFMLASCGGGKGNGPVIKEDDMSVKETYEVWMPLQAWSLGAFNNRDFGENEVIQEIEKKFNVEFNFTHPVTGSELDQFSLMITEKNLPDLIFSPTFYVGGVEAGIHDGAYVDLTEYVPEYMPNYNKLLQEDDEIRRITTTDSGQIGAIYGASRYEEYAFYGPIIKEKWMKDVGEEIPITIDDWERMLTKFKDQKGATAPFILLPNGYDYTAGTFMSAYGVAPGFYLDNNEIKYGPNEEGYYQYLNRMRDWYNKGLIDPNFAEKSWDDIINQITSSEGGSLTQSPDTMTSILGDAGIPWVAAPYPVLKKGDTLHFRQKSFKPILTWTSHASISTSCKNITRLMKVLDYGYTDEGATLFNFGIKDRTYVEEEDGTKEFTDLIYNNSYGLTTLQTLWRYKCHDGLFIRDDNHSNPLLISNPKSMEARQKWSETPTDAVIPPLNYTRKESQEISALMGAVNTYVDTQIGAFLIGQENDLSNGDVITNPETFRKNIAEKGLTETFKIVEAAYTRYLAKD